jgi:CRISPR-associated protein Cmr4
VLEDLVYPVDRVVADRRVGALAAELPRLLPPGETATRERVQSSVVVIPDYDLLELVERTTPVQARTQLTSAKTTSKVGGESGNLWYEESLPADCLLTALVAPRRHWAAAVEGSSRASSAGTPVERFARGWREVRSIQIGGNETVGQGLCWWRLLEPGQEREDGR